MSARDDIAAHFTSDTLADQLLDAYRAEVLREAADNIAAWGRRRYEITQSMAATADHSAERLRAMADEAATGGASDG